MNLCVQSTVLNPRSHLSFLTTCLEAQCSVDLIVNLPRVPLGCGDVIPPSSVCAVPSYNAVQERLPSRAEALLEFHD